MVQANASLFDWRRQGAIAMGNHGLSNLIAPICPSPWPDSYFRLLGSAPVPAAMDLSRPFPSSHHSPMLAWLDPYQVRLYKTVWIDGVARWVDDRDSPARYVTLYSPLSNFCAAMLLQ